MNPSASVDAVQQAQTVWRRQAAELGGRNTLLWHRDLPLGTFELTVAHPGGVAKLLAGRTTLLSELVRESVAYVHAHQRVSAIRHKVVELRREHGLTCGFLSVGMASWPLRRAPVQPRAPVLLRECAIEPTDATHRDFALRLDQAVSFNPVLEHYLRSEMGLDLDIDALASLATRGSGFDPRPTYGALERLCAEVPGFMVGPQLVLGTFPLAKLPFVVEMATAADVRAANPFVSALTGARAGTETEAQAEALPIDPLDDTGDRVDVLDADSEQQHVLAALSSTAGLVLASRPGTGRTQTVANAAAAAVARRHTVLVVAEAHAALGAVRDRLAAAGCPDLVLELGETPAAARRVSRELVAALDAHRNDPPPSAEQARPRSDDDPGPHLAVLRNHERAMHEPREPLGVSLSRVQAELTELAARQRPPQSHVRLDEAGLRSLTSHRLPEVARVLTQAAEMGAWQRGRSDDPWYAVALDGPDEAQRAWEIVRRLVGGQVQEARASMRQLCRQAGLPEPLTLKQWADYLDLMGRVRDTLDVFRPQVYEAPLDVLVAALRGGGGRATERPSAITRTRLRRQARALLRPGRPPADLHAALSAARDERAVWESLAGRAARPTTPPGWEEANEEFEPLAGDLGWLATRLEGTASGKDFETTHLDLLLERLLRLDARADRVPTAAEAHRLLSPLRRGGLGSLVDDLAHRGVGAEDVASEVELVYWTSVHDRIRQTQDGISDRERLEEAVAAFAQAEARARATAAATVRHAAYLAVADALTAHPAQEPALRAAAARDHADVREVLAAAPDLVAALRPVWLASPLVVPAAVPAGMAFDLVVVMQAQAVPVAHAIPAVSRARRLLVAGDPDGAPPCRFLTAVVPSGEGGVAARGEPGDVQRADDLLSVASTVLPVHRLTTVYGVRDQRLVVGGGACGFPGVALGAAVTHEVSGDREGVIARTVDAVVGAARRGTSLAVLTGDDSLAEDVDRALRSRLSSTPGLSLDEHGADGFELTSVARSAAVVRDRVVLALGPVDALAETGGAAALAAARESLHVVSDLDLPDWPPGPGLDPVRTALGGAAEVVADGGSNADGVDGDPADVAAGPVGRISPVLDELARRLRGQGLSVRRGYGVGRHRIQLVVDDPARTDRPLLAIDTDAYPTRGLLGRDHVRLRAEQLSRLGWVPVMVWTTVVFRDPAREVARIVGLARQGRSGG